MILSRYAAWCRRQGSQLNCGHAAAGGAGALLIAGLAAWWFVATYWTVICEVFWLTAGALAAAVITAGLLASGEARARAWRRTRCADCRVAEPIAQVTYANGLRHDTVLTCGPCWKAAERAALAASGTVPGWDWDDSGHPPRVTEIPALAAGCIAGQAVPAARKRSGLAWTELTDEAAAIRSGLAAAPDNEPPEDEHTAAELARVLEQAAPAPALLPPPGWTRGQP